MSEMEVNGTCPFCGHKDIFIFSGSGQNATCFKCNKNIKHYSEVKGWVVSYNG